ncbi:MAG: methyltransferase domain-containing protein [Nitrospiraceae bacterium]|nr:MAG: methyltransferase domain-containing protein [Nitrospiraceae bacterium]
MSVNLKHSVLIWLINQIQKFGPEKVVVLGKTYEISRDVFNPERYYTSRFMAEHIHVAAGDKVLDMGTGSGIQAVTAARTAGRVIAVDINPEAVRFAARNIRAHGLEEKVSVIQGDLFSSLDPAEKFDVILFTPPYFDGRPGTLFEHALIDPDKSLIKRFFGSAKNYLKEGGYVQMLYSSIAGNERVLRLMHGLGWEYSLMARSRIWMETFFIYKSRPL